MPIPRARADSRGTALLPVLVLMLLFSGIALAVSAVVRIETLVSTRFRAAAEALYAAEAGLAAAIAEIRGLPAWTPLLAGGRVSRLSTGTFGGTHALSGGGRVTLCCRAGTLAERLQRDTAMAAVPERRTLSWQPFLWAPLDRLVPGARPTRLFLLVSIRDDEGDGDGNGGADANGVVVVRADVIDPGGLHRAIEMVVARRELPARAVEVVQWREIR